MRWAVALVFLPLILASGWPNGELEQLLEIARKRMRCISDSKCLEESGIQRLLRTENLKEANPEDLSIVLAHHLLHGDFSCTILIPRLEIVEEEVMRAIGTEDISGILRIFRRILKDDGKAECVSTENILRQISPSSHTFSPLQWVRSVLGVFMEEILKGKCINASTTSDDSLDDIFKHYGEACSPYLTVKGLENVMNDLESAGNNHHHHHLHHHGHHHFGDHSHSHECDHHESEQHHHDYHDHSHEDHDHSNHYHSDHNNSHDHSEDHLLNNSYQNFSKSDPSNYDSHNHSSHEHDNQYFSVHNLNNHKNSIHYHDNHDHYEYDDDNHNHSAIDRHHSMDAEHKHNNNSTYDIHSLHKISGGKENKENPMSFENDKKTNYSEIDVLANNTFEVSVGSLMALNESGSEHLESILPSGGINNLWQPTTMSNEEASLISNTILPLNTHSRVPFSQCLSAETLVSQFGYDRITISKAEFLSLCPVLVQQAVGDGCGKRAVQSFLPSKLEVYGYGSACVFVLCLASLSGVFLLPLMRRSARHYVIAGFQGLAFSTLASDALLHLIPEFLGLHSHNSSQSHSHEHASFPEPYAQLLLGVLATTYVLFMMEAVLCAISGRSHDNSGHGHTHVHHISEPTLISIKSESPSQLPISGDQSCSSLDTELAEMETAKKPPNLMVSQPVLCGLTSLALVVTLGDALHNFGDGLAIGAAFSANIRGGLSTTAAAFCHELPHELGDFVVLLSTGLSFTRALLLNFLSALTCFGGLYVGILVGDNEVARKWVMAVTASTFLYVALAEMVPELRDHRHGTPFKMLLVKNIGILAGIAIMCVISIYEHEMG